MSNLTWLLEKDCFEDSQHRLIESIKKAGQAYEFVEYIPVVKEARVPWASASYIDEHRRRNDKLIFHGSINLGRVMKRYADCIDLFCTWENYKCSKYYAVPYIQRLLLNDCALFCPYGNLKNLLQNSFYRDCYSEKVFIRPDSGAKPFSGTIVEISALDKFFYQSELYEQIKPEDLCVVSPVVEDIYAEYRCIVINNKAVTCSRYICNHSDTSFELYKTLSSFDNTSILTRTQELLDMCSYRPDEAFTVDWAITLSGKVKIIEFNSFSCASMYECDTDKIVKAMGEMLCS